MCVLLLSSNSSRESMTDALPYAIAFVHTQNDKKKASDEGDEQQTSFVVDVDSLARTRDDEDK